MIPILYSSPTCQPCRAVSKWLTQHNIPYESRNGADHIDYIQELTGRAQVPVLVYKDHVITGFDMAALRKAFPI